MRTFREASDAREGVQFVGASRAGPQLCSGVRRPTWPERSPARLRHRRSSTPSRRVLQPNTYTDHWRSPPSVFVHRRRADPSSMIGPVRIRPLFRLFSRDSNCGLAAPSREISPVSTLTCANPCVRFERQTVATKRPSHCREIRPPESLRGPFANALSRDITLRAPTIEQANSKSPNDPFGRTLSHKPAGGARRCVEVTSNPRRAPVRRPAVCVSSDTLGENRSIFCRFSPRVTRAHPKVQRCILARSSLLVNTSQRHGFVRQPPT